MGARSAYTLKRIRCLRMQCRENYGHGPARSAQGGLAPKPGSSCNLPAG